MVVPDVVSIRRTARPAEAPGDPARSRLGCAIALLLIALASPAAGQIIPPGNEAVVEQMLGTGETFPGDCKLAGGSIERTAVVARYDCSGGRTVAVELRHPSDAPQAATRTERFAIVARGPAPAGFVDAIARRVAAAEAHFRWMAAPPAVATAPPAAAPSGPPPIGVEAAPGAPAVVFLVAVLAAPLAVVAGVLWSLLAGLGAPPRRGEPFWTERRRRFACYFALFLAVGALGLALVVPQWWMQIDEERDFMLSALCAAGKACPLVGNEMNQLRIKLGPLNRYLMTLCQLVTPDPRFVLGLILALHALAAAWLAETGDSLLGFPFGLIAGLVFGTNPILCQTIAAASNGAWSSLFLVGTIAGTLRWVRGDRRALVLAITCLAAAGQLHGINLVLVPPFLLAALVWRPPVSTRVLAACVIIVVALYSPWLFYQWETGGRDFLLVSTSWMVSAGPGLMERVFRIVPTLGGVLTAPLALAGGAALAAGRSGPPARRAEERTVLLFLALPLGATLLAGGSWAERYAVPIVAPGALAAAAGLRALASWMARKERWQRRARLVFGALAVAWAAGLVFDYLSLPGRPLSFARGEVRLGLAEQIEAIRTLGEHGFGAADLESRVHGVSWNRWSGGQVYLGEWLIGAASSGESGEHAVIVECEHAAGRFPSWQHRLVASSRGLPHLLVGYRPQLAPVTVELVGRNGVLWTRKGGLPFYGQMVHGGDARMRARFDPKLAFPPQFSDLQSLWSSDPPAQMKLATALAPGREDRRHRSPPRRRIDRDRDRRRRATAEPRAGPAPRRRRPAALSRHRRRAPDRRHHRGRDRPPAGGGGAAAGRPVRGAAVRSGLGRRGLRPSAALRKSFRLDAL